jgi:hypothetical protein
VSNDALPVHELEDTTAELPEATHADMEDEREQKYEEVRRMQGERWHRDELITDSPLVVLSRIQD